MLFVYSIATATRHPELHIILSPFRTKSKPRAASNPDPMSSSPAYWTLHHVDVAMFEYNFSTYSYLDRDLSFSVEPFRNMLARLISVA